MLSSCHPILIDIYQNRYTQPHKRSVIGKCYKDYRSSFEPLVQLHNRAWGVGLRSPAKNLRDDTSLLPAPDHFELASLFKGCLGKSHISTRVSLVPPIFSYIFPRSIGLSSQSRGGCLEIPKSLYWICGRSHSPYP